MAMVENIERVGNNFLLNIQVATTTAPGKVIAGLSFVSAFFADSLYLFIALFAMIIIDFFFGLSVSIKSKGKGSIESGRIKDTGLKLLFNMTLLLLSFIIEKTINEKIDTSEIGTT